MKREQSSKPTIARGPVQRDAKEVLELTGQFWRHHFFTA
jgi:hypothetical protein